MSTVTRPLERRYDVVIIGGGVGGLTAGNLLAMCGKKVLLLEKSHKVGGYLSGWKKEGFEFNAGCQSFPSNGLFFPLLRRMGILEPQKFKKASHRIAARDVDLGVLTRWADVADKLRRAFPREAERIGRFCEAMDRVRRLADFWSRESSQFVIARGPAKALRWLRHHLGLLYFLRTLTQHREGFVPEIVHRYFPPGSELAALFVQPFYNHTPALCMPWTWRSWMEEYWYYDDGFQALADRMAANLQSLGGEVLTENGAKQIVVRQGRAEAVVDAAGREWPCRYVVVASDYKKAFLRLMDKGELPETFRRSVSRGEVSESFVTLFVALDMPPEELRRRVQAYNFFFYPDYEVRDPRAQDRPDYFDRVWIELTAQSLAGGRFAPEGRSALIIQTLSIQAWNRSWGREGGPPLYNKVKAEVAKKLLCTAEEVIPGLGERVLFVETATPYTKELWTENSGGATAGWSYASEEPSFLQGGAFHVTTPLPNIFTASQWSLRLGGVATAAVAGHLATEEILRSPSP